MNDQRNLRPATPQKLFGDIAKRYDFINSALTCFQLKRWRRQALLSADIHPTSVLDVCCGTGEMGVAARRVWPDALIYGVDINHSMLSFAKKKNSYDYLYSFSVADGIASLKQFDCILLAFAFYDLGPAAEKAIQDLHDLLSARGELISIELEPPTQGLLRFLLRTGMEKTRTVCSLLGVDAVAHMLDEVLSSPGTRHLQCVFEAHQFELISSTHRYASLININVFRKAEQQTSRGPHE